jgi:hypothetical protein
MGVRGRSLFCNLPSAVHVSGKTSLSSIHFLYPIMSVTVQIFHQLFQVSELRGENPFPSIIFQQLFMIMRGKTALSSIRFLYPSRSLRWGQIFHQLFMCLHELRGIPNFSPTHHMC